MASAAATAALRHALATGCRAQAALQLPCHGRATVAAEVPAPTLINVAAAVAAARRGTLPSVGELTAGAPAACY